MLRTVALIIATLALGVLVTPAWAGTANGGLPGAPTGNPLAGIKWGVYQGPIDEVWPAYVHAQGRSRQMLAKIALAPRAVGAGAWDGTPQATAREAIYDSNQGNPNVLTQVAIFRLDPWESCS